MPYVAQREIKAQNGDKFVIYKPGDVIPDFEKWAEVPRRAHLNMDYVVKVDDVKKDQDIKSDTVKQAGSKKKGPVKQKGQIKKNKKKVSVGGKPAAPTAPPQEIPEAPAEE